MKQFFILLGCLSSFTLLAQKPFEGKIIYQMSSSSDGPNGNVILSFMPNNIRIDFKAQEKTQDGPDENEVVIISLDSGAVFTVNHDNKTVRRKPLQRFEKTGPVQSITIAGQKASTVDLSEISPLGYLSSMMAMGKTTIYTSDNLYFPVPDELRSNAELAMLYKGRILLGAKVVMKNPAYAADTVEQNFMTIMATEVSAQKMNRGDLTIPANYTAYNPDTWMTDSVTAYDTTLVIPDTLAIAVDTVSREEPAKAPAKTPAKKPAPKKKTGTKSSPARKDD